MNVVPSGTELKVPYDAAAAPAVVPAMSTTPDEPDPITTGLLQEVSVLVESQSSNKVIVILYSVAGPVPAFTFGKNNKLKNKIL